VTPGIEGIKGGRVRAVANPAIAAAIDNLEAAIAEARLRL